MYKVFIDGQVGTTGLQIYDRLSSHQSIEIIEIPEEKRKDLSVKKDFLNNVDAVILCLPDEAAIESVNLIENNSVKVLDASTAHRINDKWTYGLPELVQGQRERIQSCKRLSVPGCYPTGFSLAVRPLVDAGIIPLDYPITVNAVSGYSGGGRKLIESYENRASSVSIEELWTYRPYALQLQHKHLPEMKKYTGLLNYPVFVPSVGHFHQGMLIQVPLILNKLAKSISLEGIHEVYSTAYSNEKFISVFTENSDKELENGFLSPTKCNGSNHLDLFVFGNKDQAVLIARLDNLGKGASGAAVQNLNLMLGIKETEGLM